MITKKDILRNVCAYLLVICGIINAHAEEKAVPIIRAWQLDQWSGVADTLATIDSSYMHFPMRDKLNDYSISNIGNSNLISPILSRIYFDRTKTVDFIFADAYTPYIITPQQVKYHNSIFYHRLQKRIRYEFGSKRH